MSSSGFKDNLSKHNKEFDDCFREESRKKFIVVENDKKISVIKDFISDDELGLKIINSKPPIGFLSFDGCYVVYLKGYSGKRCDCLLFTNRELLFVELKLDISNSKIAENLREGRKQLSNTITYFHDYFKDDFNSFFCNAIVVLPKQSYPRRPARLASLKKHFFLDNYGVEYFEDPEFVFEK